MPAPRRTPPRHPRRAALACLLLTGCAFLRLPEEVEEIQQHGVAAVVVRGAPAGCTTFAVAWRERVDERGETSREFIGLHPVDGDGVAFFLLANEHTYHVAAFADVDGDGAYDVGEPAALRGGVAPKPLDEQGDPADRTELSLAAASVLPDDLALEPAPTELGQALEIDIGEVASLDEPRFGKQAGERGMWEPFGFFAEHGLGLYFVEPYDPERVPVLFVHGIADGPATFTDAIAALDRERQQAWFFHYPSGFRVGKVADGLAAALRRLRREHGFERLSIVAHSMGGLVARDAIQQLASGEPRVRVDRFVTVSTPWSGHAAATIGVDFLRHPVPAWRDLVPGSAFLQRVVGAPLPEGTTHDLVFGFCTQGGVGMPNDNDGVVGVESQLAPAVQRSARSVFGLPCDHHAILHDERAIAAVRRALRDAAQD